MGWQRSPVINLSFSFDFLITFSLKIHVFYLIFFLPRKNPKLSDLGIIVVRKENLESLRKCEFLWGYSQLCSGVWQSLYIISANFPFFSKNTLTSSFQPTLEFSKMSYNLFCLCIESITFIPFWLKVFLPIGKWNGNERQLKGRTNIGEFNSLIQRNWNLNITRVVIFKLPSCDNKLTFLKLIED